MSFQEIKGSSILFKQVTCGCVYSTKKHALFDNLQLMGFRDANRSDSQLFGILGLWAKSQNLIAIFHLLFWPKELNLAVQQVFYRSEGKLPQLLTSYDPSTCEAVGGTTTGLVHVELWDTCPTCRGVYLQDHPRNWFIKKKLIHQKVHMSNCFQGLPVCFLVG